MISDAPVTARRLAGRRVWVYRFFFLFISLVVAAFICEAAVRLFCPPYIMPRWVESAPYGIRKQIGNIRGFIVTSQYRHRFTTNSKGFRGTNEYAIPKPPNVFRVLALGDSVVCGYGVEDDQTFSAVLQRQLSARRSAEVLNLAVPGFGTAEELIQLENVGLEYQPDLVILGYFINDHFDNLTSDLYRVQDGKLVRNAKVIEPALYLRDHLSRIPGYTFLCQHSYFINFLRQSASSHFRSKAGQKHALEAQAFISDKPNEQQIVLTSALLDEIIRVCIDRGIRVVVLNIPMEKQGAWMQNLPTDRLGLKPGVRIVDVASDVWQDENIWNIAHKNGSYHPKARGHELIADWLANYIQTEVWEPAKPINQ
jgi:lysophospholipase L1-like esterase